ncbi:MAG TPA: hypothetical protein QF772_05010 [Nitrospinaceae bacterium]|jgi:hypothetical protein|nr:hypothetical protein [Nitrospinaceae bacterium]HJO57564.1 hypothetical protein [Nitrospinaceae bacterium]
MSHRISDSSCAECGSEVKSLPTTIEFRGQEIHLFHPALCVRCLENICERYSTLCANCGEAIPPYSQVGVLKGNGGENQFVHMTTSCLTVGSAFHGYWGKGKLHNFMEIEAC